MKDKSLLLMIVALVILASLAILSGLYKWEAEAVVVAFMGFTFIVYWDRRKEKQYRNQESRRVARTMLGEITFNLKIVAQNKTILDNRSDTVPVKYHDASWHALSSGGYLLVLPDDLVEKLSNLYRSILDSNRFVERIEELTVGMGQALTSAAGNRQALRTWVLDSLDSYGDGMIEIKAGLIDFLRGLQGLRPEEA
jgi:membrane protein implicated in regulation of membrane protease activity